MNTITRKELNGLYLKNETAIENAKKYFTDIQPSIFYTGFYSSDSWNWGYEIGICGINGSGRDHDGNGIQSGTVKYFEVVKQFGEVVAAREVYLPIVNN